MADVLGMPPRPKIPVPLLTPVALLAVDRAGHPRRRRSRAPADRGPFDADDRHRPLGAIAVRRPARSPSRKRCDGRWPRIPRSLPPDERRAKALPGPARQGAADGSGGVRAGGGAPAGRARLADREPQVPGVGGPRLLAADHAVHARTDQGHPRRRRSVRRAGRPTARPPALSRARSTRSPIGRAQSPGGSSAASWSRARGGTRDPCVSPFRRWGRPGGAPGSTCAWRSTTSIHGCAAPGRSPGSASGSTRRPSSASIGRSRAGSCGGSRRAPATPSSAAPPRAPGSRDPRGPRRRASRARGSPCPRFRPAPEPAGARRRHPGRIGGPGGSG